MARFAMESAMDSAQCDLLALMLYTSASGITAKGMVKGSWFLTRHNVASTMVTSAEHPQLDVCYPLQLQACMHTPVFTVSLVFTRRYLTLPVTAPIGTTVGHSYALGLHQTCY